MCKKKCYSFKAILPFPSSCWVKIQRAWQLEQCRDGRGERKETQLCRRLNKGEAEAPPPGSLGSPTLLGPLGHLLKGRKRKCLPASHCLPLGEWSLLFSRTNDVTIDLDFAQIQKESKAFFFKCEVFLDF